ncbi:hypothetical protein [Rugosimonospora africana]|uniref:hypothetical protein n=1 Tax=Rugosimonospora africana TaxID=556532 RepID=UPI001942DDDB|nr:hypothetical protein [Rugosimonospora africana]
MCIYSTSWLYLGQKRQDLSAKLELSGLTRHYELYKDQLPRLLPPSFLGGPIGAGDIAIAEPVTGITMTESDAALFALPSNQVVLAVSLGFTTGPLSEPDNVTSVSRVLEQSIGAAVTIRGQSLIAYADELGQHGLTRDTLATDDPTEAPSEALLPERHQLVFIARREKDKWVPTQSVISELLYRDTPPYREEFGTPKIPEQLNLVEQSDDGEFVRPTWSSVAGQGEASTRKLITLGLVTPYVSLLYSHERYVEDSIFLSTVHAVGTASRFRQIWHEAYRQVRRFRDQKQRQTAGLQTRADLEELADNLGNLQFDLTFSVEFPLMRIETFHTALYEAMDLSTQAKALSQMFDQLDGSLHSELTAIDVRERRRDDGRQRWNAFAAGILSLIGVSVGFVIAFLGVNTTEVPGGNDELSMWAPHFADLYLIAALFALTPVFLISFPYLRDWATQRRIVAAWIGLGTTAFGVAVLAATLFEDHHGTGRAIVLDAIFKAVAVFALLIGLSLVGLWSRKPLMTWLRKLLARRRRPATGRTAESASRPDPAAG